MSQLEVPQTPHPAPPTTPPPPPLPPPAAPKSDEGGPPAPRHSLLAFTMIEIAISLAIIGFALVAIIGILPTGMNVQKENRQETIIAQDVSVLMDGIRNGAKGLDDLTNAVTQISIDATEYANAGRGVSHRYVYTRTSATID